MEELTSFEEGQSAKSGPGSQIGAVGRREGEGMICHSFNICPEAPYGSQIQCCNKLEQMSHTKRQRRSERLSKRVEVPNLAQAAKLELLVAMKGRE